MSVRPSLHWPLTLALVLLSTVMVGLSVVEGTAQRITDGVLDDAWRGRYDILVTHPEFSETVSPGHDLEGRQLVDPNFANISAPALSLSELEGIRGLSDVDVAAPVGFVGSVSNALNWPMFLMPWDEFDDGPIQEFDITWEVIGDDGLGERLVMWDQQTVRFDLSNWTGEAGYGQEVGIVASFSGDMTTSMVAVPDFGLEFSWQPVPNISSTVFVVDPVAEQELLGDDGTFLEPLREFDQMVAEHGPITAEELREQAASMSDVAGRLEEYPGGQPGTRPALWGAYGMDNPFIGFVRNADAYPPTRLHVSIDKETTGAREVVGEIELDIAEATRPFNASELEVGWPRGESSRSREWERYIIREGQAQGLTALSLTSREATGDGSMAFSVEPHGFYEASPGMSPTRPDGRGLGQEQTYRSTQPATLKVGTTRSDGVAPFEVGAYRPRSLDSGASYAPLGAYDPATSTLTATGEVLEPTRQALGIAAQASSALVSVAGAQELTGDDFITAVRVRVGGLEGLERDAALTRIGETARQIEQMGLATHIIAGSSLQQVDLWVPDYAFGTTDPEIQQRVDDLGWVSQGFVTLGAVQWTDAITGAVATWVGRALAVIAGLGLIVTAVLSRPDRARTHSLLGEQGFSRGARYRWTAAETWPGWGALLIATPLSLLLAPTSALPTLLILLGLAAVAVYVSNPPPKRDSRGGQLGARRQVLGLMLTEAIGISLIGVVLGALFQLATWYAGAAQQTRVSEEVLSALTPLTVMGLALLAFQIFLQMRVAMATNTLLDRRDAMRYWVLHHPARRLRTARLRGVVLTGAASVAMIVIIYLAISYFVPLTTGFLAVALACSALWVAVALIRTVLGRVAKGGSSARGPRLRVWRVTRSPMRPGP